MIADITPNGSVVPVLLDASPRTPVADDDLATVLEARAEARSAATSRLLALGLTVDDINLLLP